MIQDYVNNFRRRISKLLKPGIGLSVTIHPVRAGGAVIEFFPRPSAPNLDEYRRSVENVNQVLKEIPQQMAGGNIDAIRFAGTNISMEPDRILIIKGEDDPAEWDDEATRRDFARILDAGPTPIIRPIARSA